MDLIRFQVEARKYSLWGLFAFYLLSGTSAARAQTLAWCWCEDWDHEKINSVLYELSQPAPAMRFDGESLQKVLEQWPLAIRIDRKSLEDCGISIDEPIHHVGLPGESWLSRLESILDSLELAWVPVGDGLEIAGADGDRCHVCCLYFLPTKLAPFRVELIASIETDVTPNRWENNSGGSSISVVGATENTLGVRASMKTHLMLQRYLNALEMSGSNGNGARLESLRAVQGGASQQKILFRTILRKTTVRSSQLK